MMMKLFLFLYRSCCWSNLILFLFIILHTTPLCDSLAVTASTFQESRMQIYQLQQCESVAECLELLPDHPSEKVLRQALHVCGRYKDLDTALRLLQDHAPQSEACISLVMSIAGKCGRYQTALELLASTACSTQKNHSLATIQAAMAACAKGKAWKECLELYFQLPQPTTTLTANIVLTAMARARQGQSALHFYHAHIAEPNIISKRQVVMALLQQKDQMQSAYDFFQRYTSEDVTTRQLLISACARQNLWTQVRELNQSQERTFLEAWQTLTKVGKGRNAYWMLGYTQQYQIALSRHRNPSANGMKLLLMDGSEKYAYLLMINTDRTSTLLGVYVDPVHRKRKLSKLILALWMRLCLDAGLIPQTGIMNKPLLCLTLQDSFGYIPQPNTGVTVQICSSSNSGKILLYSPDKVIAGAFSPADIQREGLIFTSTPGPGRTIRVASPLSPPSDLPDLLIKDALDGGINYYNPMADLTCILCGNPTKLAAERRVEEEELVLNQDREEIE